MFTLWLANLQPLWLTYNFLLENISFWTYCERRIPFGFIVTLVAEYLVSTLRSIVIVVKLPERSKLLHWRACLPTRTIHPATVT